jgi:hypothetical protein
MTSQPQPKRKTGQIQMPGSDKSNLELASELAASLRADIELAKTREEHIRVTARANAAAELLAEITNTTSEAACACS